MAEKVREETAGSQDLCRQSSKNQDQIGTAICKPESVNYEFAFGLFIISYLRFPQFLSKDGLQA